MKRNWMVPLLAAAVVMTAACGPVEGTAPPGERIRQVVSDSVRAGGEQKEVKMMKIKVNGRELAAVMEDNPTTRALMEKMPMTLPMMNLYGREMCYRFGEALPTGILRLAWRIGILNPVRAERHRETYWKMDHFPLDLKFTFTRILEKTVQKI